MEIFPEVGGGGQEHKLTFSCPFVQVPDFFRAGGRRRGFTLTGAVRKKALLVLLMRIE